ncbi:MAG: hypothetical protein J6M57_01535 [Acidaminococcaceae bacterium]|nr:hypothetical protein [Acidaminococcaceae bacterium]
MMKVVIQNDKELIAFDNAQMPKKDMIFAYQDNKLVKIEFYKTHECEPVIRIALTTNDRGKANEKQ